MLINGILIKFNQQGNGPTSMSDDLEIAEKR